jgi:hypothetical protein
MTEAIKKIIHCQILTDESPFLNREEFYEYRNISRSKVDKKIQIRGMNRMNVSNVDNSPIFMVDGVMLKTIDHLVPANVNSITVLKGAESAKYGSMGLNRVIVIEMKKVN